MYGADKNIPNIFPVLHVVMYFIWTERGKTFKMCVLVLSVPAVCSGVGSLWNVSGSWASLVALLDCSKECLQCAPMKHFYFPGYLFRWDLELQGRNWSRIPRPLLLIDLIIFHIENFENRMIWEFGSAKELWKLENLATELIKLIHFNWIPPSRW